MSNSLLGTGIMVIGNDCWTPSDPWLHNCWQEELLEMKMNKVWMKIKRSQMEPGRVCIKYGI
jgi:hypothetical protein